MPDDDAIGVVRRYIQQVWNERSEEALERLVGPGYVGHSPGGQHDPGGPDGYRRTLLAAFPDLVVTLDDAFAAGDRVAARITLRGTHLGVYGGLEPSGRRVTWTGISIFRVEDGRIVESWSERDRLGLRRQLAVTPRMTASGRPRRARWAWRNLLIEQWKLLRRLAPLAAVPREAASLLRFAALSLLTNSSDRRDITIALAGARFVVGLHTAEVYAMSELYARKMYEQSSDYVARAGWTVVDVGANAGVYTVQQARRGARVVAIEPNPDCFRRLCRTIALNDLGDRVTALNHAVGAEQGAGALRVPAGVTTHGSVVRDAGAGTEIAIIPLDEVVCGRGIAHVDLLKIDVEGAEIAALRGASSALSRTARVVLEYHSPSLLAASESLLRAAGFDIIRRFDMYEREGVGILFARRP